MTVRRPLAVLATMAALSVLCAIGGDAWMDRHGTLPGGDLPAALGVVPGQSSAAPSPSSSPSAQPSGTASTAGASSPHPSATSSPGAPPAGSSPSKPASCVCSTAPFGDGTYRAGADIAAGSWSTGGVVNLALKVCSWSINHGPPKQTTLSVGLTTVHLAAGDTFTTSGCQPWRLTA